MPKKVLPRIKAVWPGDEPLTLRVRWQEDGESVIDVSGMIESFKIYASLRQSPELFRQVRVGEYGADIVWTDDIDMSADTLWRLAQEQSGKTMTAAEFRDWRKNSAHTLDSVAKALGISRRMVAYYERGNRVIPRVVMLATRGLGHEPGVFAAGYASAMQAIGEFAAQPPAAPTPAPRARAGRAIVSKAAPATAAMPAARPQRQRRAQAKPAPPRRTRRGDNARRIAEAMMTLPDHSGPAAAIKKTLAEKGHDLPYTSIRHGLGQLQARSEVTVAEDGRTWSYIAPRP